MCKRLAVPQTPVTLFCGGHVGAALANVLASRSFAVSWIDSKTQIGHFLPLPASEGRFGGLVKIV